MLIILAIVAAVTHFYRESIARRFANSALSEHGFTATELSIQTLGVDNARLSHLVLEQEGGTRYEAFGVSFPLSFPSARPEIILVEQLMLVPAASEAPPSLDELLQAFLSLPDSAPNTRIEVSRFTMPNMPAVEDIVWRSVEQRQHLVFTTQSVEVEIEVDRVKDDHHQATMNAIVNGSPNAFSSTLAIRCCSNGFSIGGMSSIELSPWLAVFQSIGLLSEHVASLDARLDGQVRIDWNDEDQSIAADAHLLLADGMTAGYRDSARSGARLEASTADPVHLSFEYPTLEWTAGVGQIDALIEIDSVGDASVQLTNLECGSVIQCTAHASLDTGPLELESIAIGSAKSSATLAITDGETTRMDISSDFTLELTGVESQGFSVASVSATQFSGSQLMIDDGVWRGDVDRMELVLDSLADRDSIVASLPMALSNLHIRDAGARVDTELSLLPQAATVSWSGNTIVVPGVRGAISFQDDEVIASSELFDDEGALAAHVDASHNVATGEGSVSTNDATVVFNQGDLSNHFLEWPYAWDVASGTLSLELEANWKTGGASTEYDASMTSRADALAGNYNDIVFSGLSTELSGSLDSMVGVTLPLSTITVEFLDVGVPVEQIAAEFSVIAVEEAVQVREVSMSAFGGRFVTDPFLFSMRRESNSMVLRPKSIQLQFMVDLAEFEDIEMSGSISGMLPLTIRERKMTITNGWLESDPPGGVIHYLPGLDSEDTGVPVSDLNLVSRALANFQYDSLTSDVNYTESGDLKLQMRLTGINPDMDDTQPVILNLGVENNIPQLLRSLQATRSIEDILERRSVN